MMTPPLPGTIILTQIEGLTGQFVRLLQALNGDPTPWTHVAMMVDNQMLFESQPDGARLTPWVDYRRRPYVEVPTDLTFDQRLDLVIEAKKRVGAGYNWPTYLYLAAYRLRLPLATSTLRRRVTKDRSKFTCSQVIDDIHRACGLTLFTGKRLPYDVTPADFARLL
ncbi:hypothetical protein ACWD2L_06095 [Streptomyces sp. NPDC002754]